MVLGTWLIGRASFELMFYNYWRVAPSLFELLHRVSKGPKRVLGFGRRQKLSCRSHFFLSGHIYPITQEFAWTNCILNSNSNSLSLFSSSKETLTFTFLQKHWNKLDYVRLPCFNLKETSFNKQPNTIKISRLFPRSCYTIIHPAPDCPWKKKKLFIFNIVKELFVIPSTNFMIKLKSVSTIYLKWWTIYYHMP